MKQISSTARKDGHSGHRSHRGTWQEVRRELEMQDKTVSDLLQLLDKISLELSTIRLMTHHPFNLPLIDHLADKLKAKIRTAFADLKVTWNEEAC